MTTPAEPFIPPQTWADRVTGWLRRLVAAPASPLDGLRADGPVAFSGCAIAARRAIETEQKHAIARDPLAAALAGRSAVAAARKRATSRNAVSAMAVRTRWFDDEVLAALATGDGRAVVVRIEVVAEGRVALTMAPPPPSATAPRQVVALGAGMDTRPWRLALPPRTQWWDVDVESVLAAKAKLLRGVARADGVPDAIMTADRGQVPLPPQAPVKKKAVHHLRAASLAFVAADVGAPGWGTALAGHDATTPTLFIAEGIIMYTDGVTLLQEAAKVAAPGSLLVVVSVTAAAAAAARASARARGSARAEWTFGSDPVNPGVLLADCGWRVVAADTRSNMARRYAPLVAGRPYEFAVRPPGVRHERESLFMVAVR